MLNNDYVLAAVMIFVIAYASRAKIDLPDYLRNLFKNNIFRVVFLSLLLIYNFEKSPRVAITVAVIFVLVMHLINEQEVRENFEYIEAIKNIKQ